MTREVDAISVSCGTSREPDRELSSNRQVLDGHPTQQASVGRPPEPPPDRGGFIDGAGNVVPRSKLPPFLTRSITWQDADDKLRTLPLATIVAVNAKTKHAKSLDKRALFDRDTHMPVFVVDQGAAHFSRPTAGNIWPLELSRIRHAIGGERGAFCVSFLVELATELTTPEAFIVCAGIAVQTMKPWRAGARLQMLVQRAPGLTKWLGGAMLNRMVGTERDQTRSGMVTRLHEVDAIMVEERRTTLDGVREHRFQLNPLLFKGNSAVIEAMHEAAQARWSSGAVNIADSSTTDRQRFEVLRATFAADHEHDALTHATRTTREARR